MCSMIVFLAGCKGCKEQQARKRIMSTPHSTPPAILSRSPENSFHGLDLSSSARTTRPADLPDLWEEVPKGSRSYEIRKDVRCIYSGIDGTVYAVPDKNHFYVQHDPLGSSTLTYYGPFKGDPAEVMNLETGEEDPDE